MRVAFDLHGTLDSCGVLRDFVYMLDSSPEYEVFIISGPPTKEIEAQLIKLGVPIYSSNIISVVDFLQSKGVPMFINDKGTWQCEDEIWWDSKGLICHEYKIDMMFDDKIRYKRNMPHYTKFVLWIG